MKTWKIILIVVVILIIIRLIAVKRTNTRMRNEYLTDRLVGKQKWRTACTHVDNSTNPPTSCNGYTQTNFWGYTYCKCGDAA